MAGPRAFADGGPTEPVFLVGWWRSGTTLFWNLLRRSGRYTCYYEPLHEHLPLRVRQPAETDPTHRGVGSYWDAYEAVAPDRLEAAWQPWFGRDRWVLDAGSEAPDLGRYLTMLVEAAPDPAVLKTTRACFRAGWLRAAFPEATIVNVLRNPRCVWTSMVGRGAGTDDPVPGERHGFFHALVAVADELGIAVEGHLYRTFYRVWAKARRSVASVADATWWYDALVRDPDAWVRSRLVDPGWVRDPPDVEVHRDALAPGIHPEEWYVEQEAAALEGPAPDGDADPRLGYLRQENGYLADELAELDDAFRALARRHERLKAFPPVRWASALWSRLVDGE